MVRLAATAVAMSVGAVGGLATSFFFRPTDAEIRSAVRSLVPPGVVVADEGHGKKGGTILPAFAPYIAVVQTSGGPANPEDRVDLFRQHAEASGWRRVSIVRSVNAVRVQYVRRGIRGGSAMILDEPVTSLSARRDADATTRRRVNGVSIGAVAGLLVGLGLLSVRRSPFSSGVTRPTTPTTEGSGDG